jgi:hypothetical protein
VATGECFGHLSLVKTDNLLAGDGAVLIGRSSNVSGCAEHRIVGLTDFENYTREFLKELLLRIIKLKLCQLFSLVKKKCCAKQDAIAKKGWVYHNDTPTGKWFRQRQPDWLCI